MQQFYLPMISGYWRAQSMVNAALFSAEWMSRFQEVINNDKELSWVAKFMNCDFVWQIGDHNHLFRVVQGKISCIASPTWNESWDFAIAGSEEAWVKFTQRLPPP